MEVFPSVLSRSCALQGRPYHPAPRHPVSLALAAEVGPLCLRKSVDLSGTATDRSG